MPTLVTVITANRKQQQLKIKEGVGKVANAVNLALVGDHKFVVVTGEDDKKFTLKAKQVTDVRAVD